MLLDQPEKRVFKLFERLKAILKNCLPNSLKGHLVLDLWVRCQGEEVGDFETYRFEAAQQALSKFFFYFG